MMYDKHIPRCMYNKMQSLEPGNFTVLVRLQCKNKIVVWIKVAIVILLVQLVQCE